jgi:mono/diheme cytochrome c family protein
MALRSILRKYPGWIFLLAVFLLTGCAQRPSMPPAMPRIYRTTGPAMPENPTQADYGADLYWRICMACHGNKGQGLTDEWREQWGPLEMNCWQSRCHASNHPPDGFVFPRSIPAVFGPDTLIRFKTAEDLYLYIEETMPWWNPGSLSEEEAWNLTAYMLKARGALPDGIILDETNAAVFPVHQPAPAPNADRPALLILAGLLAGTAVLLVVFRQKG